MERDLQLYQDSPLFSGVKKDELLPLLECLQARRRSCARGEHIFSEGDNADRLGIVLKGRILTVYEDAMGGHSIIGTMEPGQLFCDAFSCSTMHRMPVSVVAQTDSVVLLMEVERVLHTCGRMCSQHQRLAENLVHILADKYVSMSRKMLHLSARTTRRKLLSYLSEQKRQAGGGAFAVPLNRQELADYLFVDRTGLSAEWNRLVRQGLLYRTGKLYRLEVTPCTGADCTGETEP